MFFCLTHIEVPVGDLVEASIVYKKAFDLDIFKEDSDFIDLEHGFIKVRLIKKITPNHYSSFRLEVDQIEKSYEKLLELGFKKITEVVKKEDIFQTNLFDPYNNIVTLWRPLNEDELIFPPQIQSKKIWSPEATDTIQTLVKNVPLLFRKLAREKAVIEAEALVENNNAVDIKTAVRGYIIATPDIMKERIKKHIVNSGFSIEEFKDDFIY